VCKLLLDTYIRCSVSWILSWDFCLKWLIFLRLCFWMQWVFVSVWTAVCVSVVCRCVSARCRQYASDISVWLTVTHLLFLFSRAFVASLHANVLRRPRRLQELLDMRLSGYKYVSFKRVFFIWSFDVSSRLWELQFSVRTDQNRCLRGDKA